MGCQPALQLSYRPRSGYNGSVSAAKSSMTIGGVAWRGVALGITVAVAWFVAGLAVSRLLYEARFPQWAALGRPGAALAVGVVVAVIGLLLRRWRGMAAVVALPLLVNLLWLFDQPSIWPAGVSSLPPGGGWRPSSTSSA